MILAQNFSGDRHVHARWLTGCERESELSHDGNEIFVGGVCRCLFVCLFVCLLVFFSQMMCCLGADYVSQLTAIIVHLHHPPHAHTHTPRVFSSLPTFPCVDNKLGPMFYRRCYCRIAAAVVVGFGMPETAWK